MKPNPAGRRKREHSSSPNMAAHTYQYAAVTEPRNDNKKLNPFKSEVEAMEYGSQAAACATQGAGSSILRPHRTVAASEEEPVNPGGQAVK